MKVEWATQGNPVNLKDAIQKSKGKWRFFSYCTKAQYEEHKNEFYGLCGLCYLRKLLRRDCDDCMFHEGCLTFYTKAFHISQKYKKKEATLKDLHEASRTVFKALKGLNFHEDN